MLLMACFLDGNFFRATLLFLGAAFVTLALGFGIFIPGMFCMS
jgi:hypothetical protein